MIAAKGRDGHGQRRIQRALEGQVPGVDSWEVERVRPCLRADRIALRGEQAIRRNGWERIRRRPLR